MSKVILTDLSSLQNEQSAVSSINNNNTTIEQAFDNTLSRDGSSPNTMEASLDMNSNRILNLPEPSSDKEPVTRSYFDAYIGAIKPDAPLPSNIFFKLSDDSDDIIEGSTHLFITTDDRIDLDNLPVNVKTLGAKGDGTTDDQVAIVTAVAAAYTGGYDLYWPPGTYLTTASIPNFHDVRHYGPGAVKRGSAVFYVDQPAHGVRNTLYVSTTGTEDGLSSSYPMSLSNALETLEKRGPALYGLWGIDLAAGTYTGAFAVGALFSESYVRLRGPDVSYGVPTAIIDADGAGNGLYITGGDAWWIRDIKFIGTAGADTNAGIATDGTSLVWLDNVHGASNQYTNANITGAERLFVYGGIYDGGIAALTAYNINRGSIGNQTNRPKFQNAGIGIDATGTYSHIDYCDFDTLTTGINVNFEGHVTNYHNTFTDVTVGWESNGVATISADDYTLTNVTTRQRHRSHPDTSADETFRYSQQYWPTLGSAGRFAFGYEAWEAPPVKFQYANGDAGYNLVNFGACTALWESAGNTILGLARPDANYAAIWFGDSTHQQRSELRSDSGGSLSILQSGTAKYSFRANDFIPRTDNALNNGISTFRWAQTYSRELRPGDGTPIWTSGSGTPEGAVTAPIGSLYTDTGGGPGSTLYVKESGSGNTGWQTSPRRRFLSNATGWDHTGDTDITPLRTVTIPANTIGPNGVVNIQAQWSASSGGSPDERRTLIFFGASGAGVSGSTLHDVSNPNTTQGVNVDIRFHNRGTANSQVAYQTASFGPGTTVGTSPVTSTIDTTADTEIVFAGKVSNAGDTIKLESYVVEVIYGE